MNAFLLEIYSQPDVIIDTAISVRQQLDGLEPLLDRFRRGEFEQLVFTGMGSSLSCVYPSLLRLTTRYASVHVIEAAELLYAHAALMTSKTLLVMISQSGRSAEIPRLLDSAAQHQMTVLGITNTPDSPLQRRSSATLLMRAGTEATVSTKTYTCTLALLHLLTSALLQEPFDEAVESIVAAAEGIRGVMESWHAQMTVLTAAWVDVPFLEFLGRGFSLASASTAALISKESIKMPTESMNAGQFRHGPIELVDNRFAGILFLGEATSKLNLELARDIVRYGGRLALVSRADAAVPGTEWIALPDCPPALLPLVEIIPVQLFCAEMSVRHGFEAGHFRYIGKVTLQE